MSTRTGQQELNFRGQLNLINLRHLALFAYMGAVTISRGHVYRYAEQIGASNLEITTALGRDLTHLKRVGNLADTYGRPTAIELTHAAWLALACFGLRLETITASIESDATMLRTLGPTGRFVQGLVEWRRRVACGEPPPAESIAMQVGHHLGIEVDEYSVADISSDLADALPSQLVDAGQILTIVARHRGAIVTPELCHTIAEDVVSVGFKPVSATAPA